MGSREQITELLNQLTHDLKTLEIAYEKYFLGMEKRAPEKERQKLTLRMRKMITLYIPQTDLRYKLQSITSRFNSYCGYWDRIQRLIDGARAIFPDLGVPDRTWMGFRPSMPDSLPVIGPSQGGGDLIHAFGHGHIGLTLAPITASIVSDLVAGRPSVIDISAYRATRF